MSEQSDKCPACDEDDEHCICDQRLSEEEYAVLTWEAPDIPYPIDTLAEHNKAMWASFWRKFGKEPGGPFCAR